MMPTRYLVDGYVKPCPFCGSGNIISNRKQQSEGIIILACMNLRCPVHVVFTGIYSEVEVIRLWNLRHEN